MGNYILTTDTHYGIDGDKTRKNHEKYLNKMAEAIKENNCLAVIHAGDWITHRQEQLEKTFELFRSKIEIPIFTVFGNHDFWNERTKNRNKFNFLTYEQICQKQIELLKKYNITHVGDTPTVFNDILFMGMNGWYNNPNPPTNDLNFMSQTIDGKPTHDYLAQKAYNDLNKVLMTVDSFTATKKVFLTHFPPLAEKEEDLLYSGNPRFLEEIKSSFDILIYGHTHEPVDKQDENLRILNAGAKYNFPDFKIISL